MENISYWFIENGKPKNIYGFWVKHTNNGPLSRASLKHHWKCCDCRRRQFNESLSNICGSFKNSWEKKNSINSKERNVKVILHLNCVVCVKVLKVRWKTWHHNMTIWKTLDSSRQPIEQHSLEEMIIAEITDEKLERAMNQYWRVANRW